MSTKHIIEKLNESYNDLSKDLYGDKSSERMNEYERKLDKYIQLALDVKEGKNDTITLNSAKKLVKDAYIYVKGYASFEPDEIDKRIAKDIPELFGNELNEDEIETSEEEVDEEPETELSEEDQKVQDVIDELKSKNNMYAWVIEDILDDSEDYSGDTLKDRVIARCNEIYEHGCVSGTVGSLIYYSDTTRFFNDNWDDIYDMLEELDDGGVEPMEAIKRNCSNTEILMGTDQVKNWIAWMCYEEIAYQLMEKLEEL